MMAAFKGLTRLTLCVDECPRNADPQDYEEWFCILLRTLDGVEPGLAITVETAFHCEKLQDMLEKGDPPNLRVFYVDEVL
jgi:hypothetical protein